MFAYIIITILTFIFLFMNNKELYILFKDCRKWRFLYNDKVHSIQHIAILILSNLIWLWILFITYAMWTDTEDICCYRFVIYGTINIILLANIFIFIPHLKSEREEISKNKYE